MTPRGDCPESLRRTALSWAVTSNTEVRLPDRSDYQHLASVYHVFADVFASRAEFDQLVVRRLKMRRLTNENSLRPDDG